VSKKITIGIDEVGRGALAGPVVLAAVLSTDETVWNHPKLGAIRDSKRLTLLQREIWARYLKTHPAVIWRVARVTPAVIDRINISGAANLAARRLVSRIVYRAERRGSSETTRRLGRRLASRRDSFFVYLDGGLILPKRIPHETVMKGDERIPAVAAASIIAKVWRDAFMRRLGRKFPAYAFETHKGYGTSVHRAAIAVHGYSDVHRRTFVLSHGV